VPTSDARGRAQPARDLLDPADPDDRDEVVAWLALQAACVLAPQQAVAGLRRGLSPRALVEAASPARRARARRAPADVPALCACGARVLPWTSTLYPERLRRLVDAPPVLLLQGGPAVLAQPAVSIVGARAATRYGRSVAGDFARALAGAGVTVVSGLARGIDAAAHEGALQAGGRTLAVQARGPERVYPAAHRDLATRMRAAGGLLTEFPVGMNPRRPFFPMRNRIIAALGRVVLVVEGRFRSGSLVTARHALDQGGEVMAVPGPIGVPTSEGPNALLRDGASPALEPADVLAAAGIASPQPSPASPPEASAGARCAAVAPASGLGERILDALADAPATAEELARRLAVAPAELGLPLAELEIDGQIEQERDGRLCRRGRRRSGASC